MSGSATSRPVGQHRRSGSQCTAKPLAGVTVVDFSRLLPGAYCTWILATLGAEIIKVEQPGKGDYQRDIGVQANSQGGALFQLVNQGKRSIGLNLKSTEARPILNKLLETADVVVESFRPGVAMRLGIDFETLRAERPSVVCVSISGFGSNSPMRMTAAHDINYLALSGLMSRQLQAGEGIPDIPLVDLVGGGLIPALSILALLHRARVSGVGGIADASLADAMSILPYEILACALLGVPEPRKDEAKFGGAAPNYSVYALRDGYVAVGAVEEKFWHEFCRRMELRFVSMSGDREELNAIKEEISGRFLAMSRSEVKALFEGVDACVTVVQSYTEMLASEHARVRNFVSPPAAQDEMPRLCGPFFHDGSRGFAEGFAPALGEHSAQILKELGYTPSEVDAFSENGVVTLGSRPESNIGDNP